MDQTGQDSSNIEGDGMGGGMDDFGDMDGFGNAPNQAFWLYFFA